MILFAEPLFAASMVINNSIRWSFAGWDVDWIINTSSPLIFSLISTNISLSANLLKDVLANDTPIYEQIASAKILSKYAKSGSSLKIVAGYMDGKVLEAEDVAKIATLPTLDEARAKIVGILSTPAQKFLSILLAPGSKIAILAHEKSKKN